MSSNRLKLNAEKTQFTYLGTKYQFTKVDGSVLVANGSVVDFLPVSASLSIRSSHSQITFDDSLVAVFTV